MSRGERVRILMRGAASLMLAMGLGRFAFTALLPDMQAAAGFGDGEAGVMAALNLAAYLVGVIWAGRMRRVDQPRLFRLALAGAVVAVAAMGLPLGVIGWDAVRLLAGLTSGLLFVLATAFVLESGAALGPSGAALHFAGVGTGIAFSGLVAASIGDWRAGWGVLALVGLALAAVGTGLPGKGAAFVAATASRPRGSIRPSLLFGLLVVAYSLEGLGYIVSGTFLVAILRRLPETAALAPYAWIVAGLSAIVSPLVWSRLAHAIGPWWALAIAYVVQAVGIAAPLGGTVAGALVAASSFGFTFIGITGVSIALAARLQPGGASAATAAVTVGYGIGQVVGPWAAGMLAAASDGFALPLVGAATAVALSAVFSVIGGFLAERRTVQCPM